MFIDFKKASDSGRKRSTAFPMDWYNHEISWRTKICANETYTKDRIGKYLSDRMHFAFQNFPKQWNSLQPLLSNFVSEYASKKV